MQDKYCINAGKYHAVFRPKLRNDVSRYNICATYVCKIYVKSRTYMDLQ